MGGTWILPDNRDGVHADRGRDHRPGVGSCDQGREMIGYALAKLVYGSITLGASSVAAIWVLFAQIDTFEVPFQLGTAGVLIGIVSFTARWLISQMRDMVELNNADKVTLRQERDQERQARIEAQSELRKVQSALLEAERRIRELS